MHRYTYISLIILSFVCHNVFSQDLTAQMKSFMLKAQVADYIYYKSTVLIEYTNGSPEKHLMFYQHTPEGIYYKTDKMEMMVDKTLAVMVYRENKVVVWQKTDPAKEALKGNTPIISDTILSPTDSIVYEGQSNGLHRYIVYTNKNYVEKMEFLFKASDGLLKQAIYYYNPSQNPSVKKSTLTFEEFTLDQSFSLSYKWSSVLSYSNKQYRLMSGFTGYQLIYLDHNY